MDDSRVWALEESLLTSHGENYRKLIDDECVMVLPEAPYVFTRTQAIKAVVNTPRWLRVTFSDQQVMRPQEGLSIIAYKAEANREGADDYEAFCTTSIRRLEHDEWRVVQHQRPFLLRRAAAEVDQAVPADARLCSPASGDQSAW